MIPCASELCSSVSRVLYHNKLLYVGLNCVSLCYFQLCYSLSRVLSLNIVHVSVYFQLCFSVSRVLSLNILLQLWILTLLLFVQVVFICGLCYFQLSFIPLYVFPYIQLCVLTALRVLSPPHTNYFFRPTQADTCCGTRRQLK